MVAIIFLIAVSVIVIILLILIKVAEVKEKNCIRDKKFKVVVSHIITGGDGYCFYFNDQGNKKTIIVSRDSQFLSEYIGKVMEEIELETNFFLSDDNYLRMVNKQDKYDYFNIIDRADGYLKPEPIVYPIFGGW